MFAPSVSVIIPTLNAASEIDDLLTKLDNQSLKPHEIMVIDSSSDDDTASIARKHMSTKVEVIDRKDFNHGLTRHLALLKSTGDYVLFMTQDAVPANDHLIENIVKPMLSDPRVCQVTGRQIPKADAREFERLVRLRNYPSESFVRVPSDLKTIGIKAVHSSDVCCCYRRTGYLEVGGFKKTDMSEDMLLSLALFRAGYNIAYAGNAEVFHSHNYTFKQQYKRNKAVGIFLEEHKDELQNISEVKEGIKLVKEIVLQLYRNKKYMEIPCFGIDCLARLIGNRVGRISIKKRDGIIG